MFILLRNGIGALENKILDRAGCYLAMPIVVNGFVCLLNVAVAVGCSRSLYHSRLHALIHVSISLSSNLQILSSTKLVFHLDVTFVAF